MAGLSDGHLPRDGHLDVLAGEGHRTVVAGHDVTERDEAEVAMLVDHNLPWLQPGEVMHSKYYVVQRNCGRMPSCVEGRRGEELRTFKP